MTIEGVDTVSQIPPQTLTASGKQFVCRYLPVPGTNASYCLSAQEASSLLQGGVMLVANFETSGTTYRGGFNPGVADAQAAETALTDCGIAGAPVIFSVDEDTNDQGAIDAYMDGCASVMGVGRVGLYHKYATVMAAMQGGHCKYGWQTYAWSGGQLYSGCHIYQYNNNVTVAGYGVDLNKTICSDTDFGQVGAALAPTEADLTPEEDQRLKHCEDMCASIYNILTYGTEAQGKPMAWLWTRIVDGEVSLAPTGFGALSTLDQGHRDQWNFMQGIMNGVNELLTAAGKPPIQAPSPTPPGPAPVPAPPPS